MIGLAFMKSFERGLKLQIVSSGEMCYNKIMTTRRVSEIRRKAVRSVKLLWHVRLRDVPKAFIVIAGLATYRLLHIIAGANLAMKSIGLFSVTLRIAGIYFFLPLKPCDLGVIFDCLIDGMYERDNAFVPTGGVCLDIGANIGACTAFWIKRGLPDQVIAFEPHPETYNRLRKNVSLNSWDNVETVHAALSSQDGEIDISTCQERTMAKVGLERTGQTKVKSMRLDTILEQRGIGIVELCKIDVEGHEVQVLNGGSDSLHKIKRIIIEYHTKKLRREVLEKLEPIFSIVHIDQSENGYIYAVKRE